MRSNGSWIFFFRIKREDRIEPVFKGAIVQIIFFYVPRSLIADVNKGHTVNILCYKNILYNIISEVIKFILSVVYCMVQLVFSNNGRISLRDLKDCQQKETVLLGRKINEIPCPFCPFCNCLTPVQAPDIWVRESHGHCRARCAGGCW